MCDRLENKRIAIVGSGISGLSAAWLLQHNGARVTLFESESVCGGHTLTDSSSGYPIDLGFQVFNLTTYPHLEGMFETLGVDSEPSDMSFSLSVDSGSLEWASHSLDTVFAQRKNMLSPSFLMMMYDVLRFGREAPKVLEEGNRHLYQDMSLKEYLDVHGYSAGFQKNYVLPMCAAVWSVPATTVLKFPVTMLVRFWVNHHLLDIIQRPLWRVVRNRSQTYVQRMLKDLPDVRTSCPVTSVVSKNESVSVLSEDGQETFDAVVFATHSDVTLRILENGSLSPDVKEVLESIPYSYNDVWLHQDESLMPKNRAAWASWNCIESRAAQDHLDAPVCVTYWANRLQDLGPSAPNYFVTLNPVHEPAKDKVVKRMVLSHPIFGPESVAAQSKIRSIQGKDNMYFCGAWCGYGFHEDGLKSAIEVLQVMGGTVPWVPRTVSPKIGILDTVAIKTFDAFAKEAIKQGKLRLILPNGQELSYGTPAPPVGGEKEAWRNRPPLNATLRIYDCAFFRKIISRHDTGLGEAYMDGDFEVIEGISGSGDLGSLMAVITANANSVEHNRGLLGVLNKLGDKVLTWAHAQRNNTATGSRRNIEEHYDAGNAMYKTFLDETMTYSCAVWKNGEAKTLYEAQIHKLDALIERADIQKGHKVLEIGCGWGSFAIRAARTKGCHVVGLTLSKEQLAEATKRVQAEGLEDLITLMFCDYRDTPDLGSYDRVVSCEMIEAVGHEHLPAYFATLGAALKPGGKVALQVIAAADERYEAYCKSSDFIREHIFPGGHLPSMGACVEAARGTGLSVHNITDIGEDYAVTLRKWREAWEQNKGEILSLGYSEKFWRKYRFYFIYCEGGFDARYIHTYQVTWVKDGEFELTQQDLDRALQLSKGELPNTSPTQVQGPATSPSMLTQVFLCLYCFLAGIAVTKTPVLWLSPFSTFASAIVFLAFSSLSKLAIPAYSRLDASNSSLWNLYSTHLIYSSLILVSLIRNASQFFSVAAMREPTHTFETYAQSLVAASAGFFGFVLWVEVNRKLYTKSYSAVIHYTIMLVLFSAAAYKNVNCHLMSLGLLSEGHSMIQYLRKQLSLLRSPQSQSKVLQMIEKCAFFLCRLLVHIGLAAIVVLNPSLFPSTTTYWIACSGMVYVNAVNIRRAIPLLSGKKEHAA